jgi:hypothetical protein
VNRLAWCVPLFPLACATTGGPPPFSTDDVDDRQVLTGPEGVEVRVARADDVALVQVTGVDNELEGAALLAELAGDLADRRYVTTVDGRERWILVRKNDTWTLYAGTGGPLTVTPDAAKTEALDPKTLLKAHRKQTASGRLEELRTFDVEAAHTEGEASTTGEMAAVLEACGLETLPIEIDWGGITEAQLMKYSIGSYCGAPESALKRACRYPASRAWVAERVDRYTCAFGDEPALSLEDGTLRYVVDFEASNHAAWVRDELDGWDTGSGRTVRDVRVQAETFVCADDSGEHVVVLGPNEDDATRGISYGDGTTQYRQPERRFLPEGWFFEPRFSNPKNNDNFRGYDLRWYSHLDVEDDEPGCTLVCGTRAVELQRVEGDAKTALLEGASFEPIPEAREPYALARDKRGVYYYVDRGARPETSKDYRLYVGPPGRARRQQMKDIVSDSEGEIFASRNGALKLYLGKDEAEWVRRGRRRKLLRVPIADNYDLIYDRLGVYLGKKLYTPCDDL